MATQRELILEAGAALVAGINWNTLAPLAVHRFMLRPLEEDELPSAVIYAMGDKPVNEDQVLSGAHLRALSWAIEVRIIAPTATPVVDQFTEPYEGLLLSAVMQDPSLGGLAGFTRSVGIQWDGAITDKCYCAARIEFESTYLFRPGL